MKKTLIAAAVAGSFVAPAAIAADGPNFGLYAPMFIVIGDDERNNGATSTDEGSIISGGGSRFWANYSQQMNNGMTAEAYWVFSTFNADNGGGVTTRNAYIGLRGEFGTVRMGTNEHFFETDGIFDGYGADMARLAGDGDVNLAGGSAIDYMELGLASSSMQRRDADSIWWNSNSYNGLSFKAAKTYAANATANDVADEDGVQLGVSYSNGALLVGANMADYDDEGSQAGDSFEGQAFYAGYDFGSFNARIMTIGLEHFDQDQNTTTEADGYALSLQMPVATGNIIVNVAETGDQTQNGAAVQDSGKSGWDVGYTHDFGPGVTGVVRYSSSEAGANFVQAGGQDQKVDAFVIGLQYAF
jgi:hypothetical protein